MTRTTSVFVSTLLIVLFLQLTPVYGADQPLITRDPSTGNSAFRDDGSFSVNLFSGTFTYGYGIDVPPGTNNLQPSVSLNYVGYKTKSLPSTVGSAWSLSESYIQRNTNHTPNNSTDDFFELYLDGSLYSLVYDSSSGRFHTEIESYLLIESLSGGQNDKGTYWTVKTQDGTSYRFGYRTDSEAVSNTEDFTWRWYLDQVLDTYENTISYNYNETSYGNDINTTYLSNITYNNDKTRTIMFQYERAERPDTWTFFDNAQKVQIARRLEYINISVSGQLVQSYHLQYTTPDSETKTFLTTINKIGNDASSSLPSTHFDYQKLEKNWSWHTEFYLPACFSSSTISDFGVRLGDVNNDGLIDFMEGVENAVDTCHTSVRTTWLNNATGWNDTGDWLIPTCLRAFSGDDMGVRVVDVNGDGLMDFVRGQDISDKCEINKIWLHDGTGWNLSNRTLPTCVITNAKHDNGTRFVDVNGDGLVDILQSRREVNNCPVGNSHAWINNGTEWIKDDTWLSPYCFVGNSYEDFGIRFADVNGDGLVDILRGRGNPTTGCGSTDKEVWLNTGKGWEQSTSWTLPLCFVSHTGLDLGVRIADINSDGLPDIISARNDGGCGDSNRKVYINTGSEWEDDTSWVFPRCVVGPAGRDFGIRLIDVDGDGIIDFTKGYDESSNGCDISDRQIRQSNISTPFLLKGIRTSLGGVINISYNDSTSLNNFESVSSTLNFNLWFVSNITRQSHPNGAFFTTIYNYSGGRYNYTTQEFEGFAFVKETLPEGEIRNHYFHQTKPLKGKEWKTEIYGADNRLFQVNEFLWNFTKNESGFFVTHLLFENYSTYDGINDTNNSILIGYDYDQFGNVIFQNTSGELHTSDDRIEHFTYVYNTSAWIVNTQSRYLLNGSNGLKVRESKFSYDALSYGASPRRGSVTQQEDYLNTGANPTTQFSYDSFGNLISQTDPNGHTTTYTYGVNETTSTLPDSETNHLSHTTQFTYDLGFGQVLTTTTPNHAVTEFTYDEFGRMLKEVQPYDSLTYPTKQYEYVFDGTAPEKTKVSSREQGGTTETYDTYTFIDGFGRTIQTKAEAENSKQIVIDTTYDGLERINTTSNPYFTTFSANYTSPSSGASKTEFFYDPLDRTTRIVNPDGTSKHFSHFNGFTTITKENGNQVGHQKDAFDQITLAVELNNGELYYTLYTYNPAGDLLEIQDSQNNLFQFTYDSLGRKIGMLDPDLGTWNYTYDPTGNLISQTDNRLITTSLSYDEINRVTKRNSSAEFFAFSYDVQKKGTLSQIQSPAYTTNLTYDNRLRTTKEVKAITGNESTTHFSYDSLNRITQLTLPNTETIDFEYSNQNTLQTINGILQDLDYNELNQILSRSYNNSLSSDFTYHPENLKLQRIQTSTLQDLNYTYDNATNILKIQDLANHITHNLDYDNLDRLTNAERTDTGENKNNFSLTYTYNSIGNIINISYNHNNQVLHYDYTSSPVAHIPSSVTQVGPTLDITNLHLLDINGSIKTYRFDITNRANQNLTINWTFHTGEETITNQLPIELTPNEDIFIYISTNISNLSADYIVLAETFSGQFNDSQTTHSFNPDLNTTHQLTYDANGNLIQDAEFYYEYNNFNQLHRVRESNSSGPILEEYLYDHDGTRIYKQSQNEIVLYVNPNFLQVINSSGTHNTTYYFDEQTLIARKDSSGNTFYYHPDHLGSTTLVTDQFGTVVEDTNYLPYGQPLYDAHSRFLYTGKELDRDTGLQYFEARYYSPTLRRFVSPDSIIPDPYNPQSLNRYSYVLNSPYKYVDPTGNFGILFGGSGSGSFGVSGTGDIGVIIVENPYTGKIEIALYAEPGGGFLVGPPGLEGHLFVGASTVNSLEEFEGTSIKGGVSVIPGFGGIGDIGTSLDPGQLSSNIGDDKKPFQVTVGPGVGEKLGPFSYISETVILGRYTLVEGKDIGIKPPTFNFNQGGSLSYTPMFSPGSSSSYSSNGDRYIGSGSGGSHNGLRNGNGGYRNGYKGGGCAAYTSCGCGITTSCH